MARLPVNNLHETTVTAPRVPSTEPAWDVLRAASQAHATESELGALRELLTEVSLPRSFEWEGLLRLAEDHGTSALLFQNLSRVGEVVPAEVLEKLRQRYELNVHKSLFLARELIRILNCVDGLGADAVCYKGIVLSEIYYGDMALRQAGDIDLFVLKQDVGRIKNAVRELGFTLRVPIPPEAEEDYVASGYEWSFDSSAGRGLLELQWALQPHFYAVDFEMEGLFERAVSVEVAGRSVKIPSAEDLLLVLSVHAAKHVWGRLIWLCDIVQILRRESLDWEWVKSQARELGIERIVRVTLLLGERLLAAAMPAGIEEWVRGDPAAQTFVDEITEASASGVSYDVQQVSYFRLMMRLRERRVDRWRFFTRLAFTPGPGEWETLRLPKVLFPLYRVVRLVRLVGRVARS
jgi:hypothetical protein